MGAKSNTQTTVDADHWLTGTLIPEDAPYRAGCHAQATANAFVSIKNNTPAPSQFEGILRTDLSTRRVNTSAANYHHKTALHATN